MVSLRDQTIKQLRDEIADLKLTLKNSLAQADADSQRLKAECDEARAEARLDLDWERLRSGEVRALNPGYQDVFDAYTTLRTQRDEAQRNHANLHGRYLRLEAERDEAREALDVNLRTNAQLWDDTNRLRALLREVQWTSVRDCIVHHKWEQCCPVCGGCQIAGHAPDCRLAAALEGRDVL